MSMELPTLHQELIEVGTIIEAYGIRGALKVRPFATDPVALLAAKEIWIKSAPGSLVLSVKDYQVYLSKFHSGSVILELVGLTDRDQALAMKSARIAMARKHFPTPGEDEFYWTDLLGAQVENQAGEPFGQVVEMMDNGAQSVLSVVNDVKKQRLIPFVKAFIIDVNLSDPMAKKITVDWQSDW